MKIASIDGNNRSLGTADLWTYSSYILQLNKKESCTLCYVPMAEAENLKIKFKDSHTTSANPQWINTCCARYIEIGTMHIKQQSRSRSNLAILLLWTYIHTYKHPKDMVIVAVCNDPKLCFYQLRNNCASLNNALVLFSLDL